MKEWYTLAELAELLHVGGRTTLRLLEPHRGRCHLARKGQNPRLVLWIPAAVVGEISEARKAQWRAAS